MKRYQKKKSKLPLIIAIVLIIIAGALLLWYFVIRDTSKSPDISVNDQNATTPEASKDNIPPPSESPGETTDDVPVDTTAKVIFDTLVQDGDSVVVKAAVTNSGTGGKCVVTFTKAQNKPVVHEFASSQDGGTVHCNISTISPLEFGALGEWLASLRYYTGDKQVTGEKTIIIK